MSSLFKIIIFTFVISLVAALFFVFYSINNSIPRSESSYDAKTQADNDLEMKKYVGQIRREREEWEKQNPKLAQKLREKEITSPTPTIGMSLYQIERICGQPDHSSKTTTIDGTINAYTYRKGECKGVFGFDAENRLVIINSY